MFFVVYHLNWFSLLCLEIGVKSEARSVAVARFLAGHLQKCDDHGGDWVSGYLSIWVSEYPWMGMMTLRSHFKNKQVVIGSTFVYSSNRRHEKAKAPQNGRVIKLRNLYQTLRWSDPSRQLQCCSSVICYLLFYICFFLLLAGLLFVWTEEGRPLAQTPTGRWHLRPELSISWCHWEWLSQDFLAGIDFCFCEYWALIKLQPKRVWHSLISS